MTARTFATILVVLGLATSTAAMTAGAAIVDGNAVKIGSDERAIDADAVARQDGTETTQEETTTQEEETTQEATATPEAETTPQAEGETTQEEQETTQDGATTELSAEQRQAITTGVQAGVDATERLGIPVSAQEQEAVLEAAIAGANPETNPIILEEAAYGVAYGALGYGASEEQLRAAVQGAMSGLSTAAVEQQNASQVAIVEISYQVAEGATHGAVTGATQNPDVSPEIIEAAARGTAAGAVDASLENLNASIDEISYVTHRTPWAAANLAGENGANPSIEIAGAASQLAADETERIAYTFTRTSLSEYPAPPSVTNGTAA